MRRLIGLGALILALLPWGTVRAQTPAPGGTTPAPFVCTLAIQGGLNAREAPLPDAQVTAVLTPAQDYPGLGLDETQGWMQVIVVVDGQEQMAWAAAQYLNCTQLPTPTPPATQATGAALSTIAPTPEQTATPGPETETPALTTTPDTPAPTSLPVELCVESFPDANGNGVRDAGDGETVAAAFTLDGESLSGCARVAPGVRQVTVELVQGWRPAVSDSWVVSAPPGSRTRVLVGAVYGQATQPAAQAAAPLPAAAVPGGLLAGSAALLGVGLLWVARRKRRKK